jgi:hypothetical protein
MGASMLDFFNGFGKPQPSADASQDDDASSTSSPIGGMPGGGAHKHVRALIRVLARVVDDMRPLEPFSRVKPHESDEKAMRSYKSSLTQYEERKRDYKSAWGCADGTYCMWRNNIGREFMMADVLDMIGHGNRSEQLIAAFKAHPATIAKILFDIADNRKPAQSLHQVIQAENLKARLQSGDLQASDIPAASRPATHIAVHDTDSANRDDDDADMDDPSLWGSHMSA